MIVFSVILTFLMLGIIIGAGYWKVFQKADQPGWIAFIPFYNWFVLIRVARVPEWWLLLLFVPLLNFLAIMYINIELAKQFGKDAGFGLGLSFLPFIFYPMLGFGDDEYLPSAANRAADQLEDFGR